MRLTFAILLRCTLLAAAFAPLPGANAAPPAVPVAHAVRFAAAYARLRNAPDLYAAILAARAGGTDDEKGWAANLLSECAFFLAGATIDRSLAPADVRERQDAQAEIQRRCAGAAGLNVDERQRIEEEMRVAMRHSASELGRLTAMGSAPDGLHARALTDDESRALTAGLHDDDPLVVQTVANVVASLMDDEDDDGHGRNRSIAFAAVLLPAPGVAALSEFDALQQCVFEGVCGHPRSPAVVAVSWRAPKDAQARRLQQVYAQACAQGRSVREILSLR